MSESATPQTDSQAERTHVRARPWPFLFSVVPDAGLVRNVVKEPVKAPRAPATKKKAAPSGYTTTVVKGGRKVSEM